MRTRRKSKGNTYSEELSSIMHQEDAQSDTQSLPTKQKADTCKTANAGVFYFFVVVFLVVEVFRVVVFFAAVFLAVVFLLLPKSPPSEVFLVSTYESPVPGILTVVVSLPVVLIVLRTPFVPAEMLALLVPIFSFRPPPRLMLFLNLSPMTTNSFHGITAYIRSKNNL